MNKSKIKTAALSAGHPIRLLLGAAAILLALPHAGHAQGIVRGAQEGTYEGNRIAGPVGGAATAITTATAISAATVDAM